MKQLELALPERVLTPRERLKASLNQSAKRWDQTPDYYKSTCRGFENIGLKETLEAAERAAKQVAQWPEWKRRLSYPNKDPGRETS